uniref:A1L transcription factor/late transcription factor VLTF-2 n=1 Tax=Pithovirus LCPAC103 TaxID=2506588 RepID=A0A481Z4P5_9VIRU|nr:MAG: A1L transcription factor/late transcription factor VLTF-2 [Pithovirus LCPAC103]
MSNVIYLRGVNWQHLLEQYLLGEFTEDTLSSSGKTQLKQSFEKPLVRGTTGEAPTYTYKEEGANVLIFTTNCEQFELKKEECLGGSEGEGGLAIIKGQQCRWCRDPIRRKPIGIPVAYLRDVRDDKNIMHLEGVYCTFECTFSGLKSKTLGGCVKDRYRFSEAYLKLIFDRAHPDMCLKEAHSWELHENNGGILSSEAFHNTHHYFTELPSWYFLPCKEMYRQITG